MSNQNQNDEYESVAFYAKHGQAVRNGFSKFQIGDKYYFCYYVDGEIFLISQAYTGERGRDNGIESVRKNAKLEQRFRIGERRDGKAGVSLMAGNHQEIAVSGPLASKARAQSLIASMGRATSSNGAGPSGAQKSKTRPKTKPRPKEQDYRPLAFYQRQVDRSVDGFTTFLGDDGYHYFTYNIDGHIELISEGYNSEAAMLGGVDSVISNMPDADRYVHKKYKSGKRDYRIKARNGKEIARSVWYDSSEGAYLGADAVRSFFDEGETRTQPRNRRPWYYRSRGYTRRPMETYYIQKEKPKKRPTKPDELKTKTDRKTPSKLAVTKSKPSPVASRKAASAKSRSAKTKPRLGGAGRASALVAVTAVAASTQKAAAKPKAKKSAAKKAASKPTSAKSTAAKPKKVSAKLLALPIEKPKVKKIKAKAKAVQPKTAAAKAKPAAKPVTVKKATVKPTAKKTVTKAKTVKRVKTKAHRPAIAKPKVKRIKPAAIAAVAAGTAIAAKAVAPPKAPEPVRPVEPVKPIEPVIERPVVATPPTPTPTPTPPAPPTPIPPPPPAPAPVAPATVMSEAAPIAAKAATVGAGTAAATAGAAGGFRWIWLLLPLLLLFALFGLKQCWPAKTSVPPVLAEAPVEPAATVVEPAAPETPVVEVEPVIEPEPEPEPIPAPEPVEIIEPDPVPEPIVATPVNTSAGTCGPSNVAIFNVAYGSTPKSVNRLGTFPEFGGSHGLTPTQFYEKLRTRYQTSDNDRRYLDYLFRSMGFTNGFADAQAFMFSEETLPQGSKGLLGYGGFHGYEFSQLNVSSPRDLQAFRIQSANGSVVHFMKTCGNYMYVCQ